MTIEERQQEFFDAIKRGEDPLQKLLAKRRKHFAKLDLGQLIREHIRIDEIFDPATDEESVALHDKYFPKEIDQ